MKKNFIETLPLREFELCRATKRHRIPISFQLELTARCNNNCRHCYINLPVRDRLAQQKELSFSQIKDIARQAVSLGALWCKLTGGEPLLRRDFFDIFLYLKKKGLLVSVFTNATLITPRHVSFFKKYPPRDIEISVYGVDKITYERVTRTPGSFDAFKEGLKLLQKNKVNVRLKTMALRSNVRTFSEIVRFCRIKTKDYFRFDPWLHLRHDGNSVRNKEIESERLSSKEIVRLESSDSERTQALKEICSKLIDKEGEGSQKGCLFRCASGEESFSISHDGFFQLCPCLCHPACMYDLRKGTLEDAYLHFVLMVRRMRSNHTAFLTRCSECTIRELCQWCPARAHLETGALDAPVEYFCQVAHTRAEAILKA